MNSFKHIGKDFIPHDVVAKVTGTAKYAEDFRADGMVFCRLLTSPMPHARVKNIDAAEALRMEGVLGMLTAQDIPAGPPGFAPSLTNEPMYVGEPILAVAALSEQAAEDAIERIKVDYEPLPFTFDPLESLFPGGKDARGDGFNIGTLAGLPPAKLKWAAADFARVKQGERLPMGKPAEEWNFGDVDAEFGKCKVVYDEPFVTASLAHHSMEPRTCMAYWQNGKCFVHASLQSQSFSHPALAQMLGIKPEELVLIAEYCGGGFGSKGGPYPSMAIPAYMSKKIGKPVMMRISRAEEYYLGSARNAFQGNIKVGFDAQGKLLAADVYVVQDSGAHISFWDYRAFGDALALVYQPRAMRWRGVPVFCNAPTRTAQRGPGQNQLACIMEPLVDRAARELNVDRVEIRRRNNPVNGSLAGGAEGQRLAATSAYLREALDKGRAKFDWDERKKRSGRKNGPKVTGIGAGQAVHPAGFTGFDGLVCIKPDGKLHIHTGVGNLGTFSHSGTSRIAAEVLKVDWENCVIERGDSRRNLPWNIGQFGSNTSYTMTRTNYVAAQDALGKLKEIAAKDLGGKPDDYDVDGVRVFAKTNPARSMSYGDAATRAIALGGRYDGHELPKDINPMTQASATALAGTGLVGVAKDNLPVTGQPFAFAACFIEIELDTETGMHRIVELVSVADCGTVIHPKGLETQIKGGAVQGIGMATLERLVFDPQNGLPANVGLHQQKPASYLDLPLEMQTDAVDKADPSNPVGAKGIGEPLMGAAASALLCAISDAMGGHVFNRTPVLPDMILNQLAGRPQPRKPLSINTQ
ncbi:MAG TPA: xanthine dehydrogenase family protein molybdopterin-binding subunit [Steroidobacteraceae bacterium]|nr:xanthine dehydrogenase family protein molybdopterin-binding subunit [Steroidobacteraceae bacterium]